MDESKKETLANLYALRAGMSVMSEIYDEVEEVKERFDDARYELEARKKDMEKLKNDEELKREEYQKLKKRQEQNNNYHAKTVSDYENNYIKESKKKVNRFVFAIFITIAITFLTCLILINKSYPFESLIQGILIPTIFIVIFFVKFIKYSRALFTDKKNCKSYIESLKKGKAEMEKMISDEPAVFAKFAAERAAEEKKIQPLIDECKNKVEAIQAEMKGYIDKFEAVYKATAEQFGNLVDERDWENVDLIIFNYETGRALDMRDALVQVDHERRNERLIEAVEYASSAISRSIDRGFGSLQSIMDRKFTMLGKSISHFTSEVSGLASQSVAQSKMIEGKLGELVESSHIQQALISQMDKSSSEIAENVEDMLRYTYYDI